MTQCPVLEPNPKTSSFMHQHDGLLRYIYDSEEFLENRKKNEIESPNNGTEACTEKAKDKRLYLHQVKALLQLRKYFDIADPAIRSTVNPQNSKTALVVLPTGCGKTGVAVLASYVLKASRVLVITPSLIISKQISYAYENFLFDRGIITKGERYLYVPQKVLVTKSSQIAIKEPPEMKQELRLRVQQADLLITNAHKISKVSTVDVEHIPEDCFDLVIVDEAHHYPADTWKKLVNHFPEANKIFFTATPERKNRPILDEPPCFELSLDDAVRGGIIRRVLFEELKDGNDEDERYKLIIDRMEECLKDHDRLESTTYHQGMVIAQRKSKDEKNSARNFYAVYEANYPGNCKVYDSDSDSAVLDSFKKNEFRTLVVIGKLLEGFDCKSVSVLGIVRNIAPTSRVLYAQFVGRAVRKTSVDDPVDAQVITHVYFNQKINHEMFDKVTDNVYPEDEE